MNELALFAGAGGGILGGKLLGWRTVCAVELDAYAAAVLAQRQNDGILDPFPIWSDVRTFNGYPWQGLVDVVSGGFPCQDISAAGKGAGITGSRSGLWSEMARVVREVRPRIVLVENSPMLTSRGLGVVLGDLAEMGFDAEWGVLGADDAGANHIRKRIWVLGYSKRFGRKAFGDDRRQNDRTKPRTDGEYTQNLADTNRSGQGAVRRGRVHLQGEAWTFADDSSAAISDTGVEGLPPSEYAALRDARWSEKGRAAAECDWWSTEPGLGRVANGVARRVDRLKAIGNGQVPAVVRLAWKALRWTS